MLGSMGRDVEPFATLRQSTVPWEKVLGAHQTWPMFVEPPRRTSWLRYEGDTDEGAVPLHPLPGEPPADGVIWFYDRLGKLERNAVSAKREYLRTSIVRGVCAQDPRLNAVTIYRASRTTPRAWSYATRPREAWPAEESRDSSWRCRR